jgi:hypothetical protein
MTFNQPASSYRYLTTVAALILLLLWGPAVILGHGAVIAGERYWWLGDDAMISMRYAHNFANGHGLVWNPGERVEGYSNFLWTLYMSAIHLLPIPTSKISIVVLITDLLLAAAIIPYLVRLLRLLGGGTAVIVATLAAYILNSNLLFWTASGFEVLFLSFLLLFALVRILEEARQNQPRLLTFFVVAALSLVRADSAILSGLLYALALLIYKKQHRKVFFFVAISLILPLAHEVFRILYYHDILPNTAYLKVTNWNGRFSYGLEYVGNFIRQYLFLLAFGLIGALLAGKYLERALALVFLLYSAYIAYVGGDAFRDFRFFIPVLPLLFVLSFLSIHRLFSKNSVRVAFLVFAVATTPLVLSGYRAALLPANSEIGNIRIALLLKQNTSPSAKVADFWAGQVFYFSERPAIDLLGKSDAHIARLAARPEAAKPGHNKYDFDYSLGTLRTDYVVAMFRLPVNRNDMVRRSRGDLAFTGQLYLNPTFQQHCFGNPVSVETWRTIFVCDWSPELEKRNHWQPLAE